MRTPMTLLKDISSPGAEIPDIGILGLPFDGGVTNRPGSRHGPREVRNQSSLCRQIHEVYRWSPYDLCSIRELGDVDIQTVYNIEKAHEEIRHAYKKLKELGITPLSVGGDHSVTAPLIDGLVDDEPVGLIHIDAHNDTWGGIWGSDNHHGAPMKLLADWGKIDPKRTVQIGIRGAQNVPEAWKNAESLGFRVIFMHEFVERSLKDIIEEARDIVGTGKTYISFDIDAICPSYAPGTGTPEFGGLTPREAIALLRGFRGLNIIGADLVEVAPCFDQAGNTALLASTLLYEMLCIMAEQVALQKGKMI